jgi:hypothetical protein
MDNLDKIGRSLMNNWGGGGGGGELGSSLIFYSVTIDDWRLEIADPRMLPKPILAWAQCPSE